MCFLTGKSLVTIVISIRNFEQIIGLDERTRLRQRLNRAPDSGAPSHNLMQQTWNKFDLSRFVPPLPAKVLGVFSIQTNNGVTASLPKGIETVE
jgi:hypothetical protein